MQRVWSTYLDEASHRRGRSDSPHMMDSRRSSAANSTLSQAASTRFMLGGEHPPNMPYASNPSGLSVSTAAPANNNLLTASTSPYSASSLRTPTSAIPLNNTDSSTNLSLTVNYLPAKFSQTLISPAGNPRRRKGKGGGAPELGVPKRGGGVEAFRSGENRIPGQNDEDEDDGGVLSSGWLKGNRGGRGGRGVPKKMKWTKFKWVLFGANTLLSIYSLTSLIFCLLTWFNVWHHADIVRVANKPELIVSTIAASTGIITSLIGWAGILLNNRAFLAVYTLLTWITFAFLVTPGYMTYRRRTFNLEGKINAEWSRALGTDGRLRIQNQLGCCGYFSPFVEATISATCYSRSILPGCKKRFLDFERLVLGRWYAVAFALVPFQIFVMVSALLCSNHVTYRFGKGMMPKAYRLSMGSMAVIMDNYANQLAEQYGADVATDILSRSRSNLNLDKMLPVPGAMPMPMQMQMQDMPYAGSQHQDATGVYKHTKYDSVGEPR